MPTRPHAATSSSAARCANRATSSRKKKAASSPRRTLPEADVGDYLVIGCAGAYGYVMASNYNSKPLVAEVLIENGKTHLVRAGKRSTTSSRRGDSKT